jgi:hypothetical protein
MVFTHPAAILAQSAFHGFPDGTIHLGGSWFSSIRRSHLRKPSHRPVHILPNARREVSSGLRCHALRPFCSNTCSGRLERPENAQRPQAVTLGGAALKLKIAILQYRYVGPGQAQGSTDRQLRLDCAWRCRAQGTPGWETSPPPSGVLLGGLSKYPRAGAVSLDVLRSGSRLQRKRPPTEAASIVI